MAPFLKFLARKQEEPKEPPMFLAYRSSSTFILSTICIAVFTDIFLYSVIVPVIPFALTNRVAVPPEAVQHWVSVLLAVYGAALLAASPLCGFLADKTPNRRLPLLIGLLALGGATLLLCLGTTLALLVLGRVLQGISAAIVWTVGLALLADTVGHEKIGQALGHVSVSMSVAMLVGPLIGGAVYAKAGYFSVYYVAFGMIILDIILRFVLVEKKVARKWLEQVDMQSNAVVAPAPQVPLEEEATSQARPSPSSPTQPDSSQNNTTSNSILPATAPATSKPPKKPLPAVLTLLKSRRLLAALFCTLAQAVLMTSWDAVLPLYTARIFNFNSLDAGLIFLPTIIPAFLAPLVGIWVDRRGPRVPATLGFLGAAPFLVLLRLVDHKSTGQIVLLCALLALTSLMVANSMTPLLVDITRVVGAKEASHPGQFGGKGAYATAYGLFNTAFAGGMLVGPIWAGFVVNQAGWATMCWSLAVLSVGGGIVAALFVGGWVGDTTINTRWRKSERKSRKNEKGSKERKGKEKGKGKVQDGDGDGDGDVDVEMAERRAEVEAEVGDRDGDGAGA